MRSLIKGKSRASSCKRRKTIQNPPPPTVLLDVASRSQTRQPGIPRANALG